MPIKKYGVWKGTPLSWDGRAAPDHGHMRFTDGSGRDYDAALNIMSRTEDTRLVYWLLRDFDSTHPLAARLAGLQPGFYNQHGAGVGGLGLDFLRGDFLDPEAGVLLSHEANGDAPNDILDYLDPILGGAVSAKATIYLFGQRYDDDDEQGRRGARGESSGIHDLHMNQGNAGRWERDNGNYQDGGVVLQFADGHWEGVFLAFAVQAVRTDALGDPSGPTFADVLSASSENGSGPTPSLTGADAMVDAYANGHRYHDERKMRVSTNTGAICIEAALLKPLDSDETSKRNPGGIVYLLNWSARSVSLDGWRIATEAGQAQALPAGMLLQAHGRRGFAVPDCPLSNRGGRILLTDAGGNEVSDVEYSHAQAQREGKLVYFGKK